MPTRPWHPAIAGYWHVPLDGSWMVQRFRTNHEDQWRHCPFAHLTIATPWRNGSILRLGNPEAAKATAGTSNLDAAVADKVRMYDVTYAYKRPVDGRVAWTHAQADPRHHGKATDIYGVTQDITEQKLAQDAAVVHHAAFLQALVDTIPYPVSTKGRTRGFSAAM